MDIVDNVPVDFPSDTLKDCLLHVVGSGEVGCPFMMEPLGGHKLSQLLASMLAYCLPAMEQMSMFQYMLLQGLPCTLGTMCWGSRETGDIRCLAARVQAMGIPG